MLKSNINFAVGVVLSFEAIVIPTIRSILSKLVSQEEQGMGDGHCITPYTQLHQVFCLPSSPPWRLLE